MFKDLKVWWSNKVKIWQMSPEEAYLSRSVSLADLERRQKLLLRSEEMRYKSLDHFYCKDH